MKKICFVLLTTILCASLCACAADTRDSDKTIKIAVAGDPESFPVGYEDGIRRAQDDLNEKYAQSGYKVECEFYVDDGSYETGVAVADSLAADKNITAVIGSSDMEINKTAAHVYDEAGKPFIVPFFLYDSVYEENDYGTIFSMCASARIIGEKLCNATKNTNAKHWAVCAASDEFSTAEMNGFIRYASKAGIQIMDCVNADALENSFDEIYSRWETLGVDGAALFPGDADGFNMLKKLKKSNPNLVCGGDTAFDDSETLENDSELMGMMNGFIMIDAFAYDVVSEDGDNLDKFVEDYSKETGKSFDTWFLQGYNAVGMIAESAVSANTTDSAAIAKTLHNDGYNGLCQEFEFDEDGIQIMKKFQYGVYDKNGTVADIR